MFDNIDPELLFNTIAFTVAITASGLATYMVVPSIMKRMKERGIVGVDRNKKDKKEIPELGGLSVLFGFPIGILLAAGILKLSDSFYEQPILAAIGVIFFAGFIGMLDDISDISRKIKPIILAFAALPLVVVHFGDAVIELPFGLNIDFSSIDLVYWLILVPIAITGVANAMNMSAGYNGLETGQVAIISFFLLVVAFLSERNLQSILIFSALLGTALGLNHFNGYPAVTFIGNVGTYSMGALIGAGVIMASIEFVGIIAIAPVFYELVAATYYTFIKKIDPDTVRQAHSQPIIHEDGKLSPPKGTERFKLAYLILSVKPMTEKNLVRTILSLYVICGVIAVVVALI